MIISTFILKYTSIVAMILSLIMVWMILSTEWVRTQGYVELSFSPLKYMLKYFGVYRYSLVLESMGNIVVITCMLIIISGILLTLAYIRELNINVVLGLAYTYFVLSFVLAYIILPNIWYRLISFLASLGIREGHVIISVQAGIVDLGHVLVYKWDPNTYANMSFMFGIISIAYGIYRGVKEVR